MVPDALCSASGSFALEGTKVDVAGNGAGLRDAFATAARHMDVATGGAGVEMILPDEHALNVSAGGGQFKALRFCVAKLDVAADGVTGHRFAALQVCKLDVAALGRGCDAGVCAYEIELHIAAGRVNRDGMAHGAKQRDIAAGGNEDPQLRRLHFAKTCCYCARH